MDRPTWRAGAVTALVIAVAVLAASSGKVQLWVVTKPTDDGSTPAIDRPEPVDEVLTPTPDDSNQNDLPEWVGTALQAVAAGITIGLIALAAYAVSGGRIERRVRWPRWRLLGDEPPPAEPLPEDDTLDIDIAAAHLALAGGGPADAIIAAWVQLERDAAAAGVARLAHETSAEYVERVVRRASVDPAPIGELAALYREARFSRHQLGDAHRERAQVALRRVEGALRHSAGVNA